MEQEKVIISGFEAIALTGATMLVLPIYEDELDTPNGKLFLPRGQRYCQFAKVVMISKLMQEQLDENGVDIKVGDTIHFYAEKSMPVNLDLTGKETVYYRIDDTVHIIQVKKVE